MRGSTTERTISPPLPTNMKFFFKNLLFLLLLWGKRYIYLILFYFFIFLFIFIYKGERSPQSELQKLDTKGGYSMEYISYPSCSACCIILCWSYSFKYPNPCMLVTSSPSSHVIIPHHHTSSSHVITSSSPPLSLTTFPKKDTPNKANCTITSITRHQFDTSKWRDSLEVSCKMPM